MTVVMTTDLPIKRDVLEAVSEEMGVRDNPPDGLIVHVMTETPQGVHVVDIWESEETFTRFQDERLMPAMGKVMSSKGMPMPESPPEPHFEAAYDLVRGT